MLRRIIKHLVGQMAAAAMLAKSYPFEQILHFCVSYLLNFNKNTLNICFYRSLKTICKSSCGLCEIAA